MSLSGYPAPPNADFDIDMMFPNADLNVAEALHVRSSLLPVACAAWARRFSFNSSPSADIMLCRCTCLPWPMLCSIGAFEFATDVAVVARASSALDKVSPRASTARTYLDYMVARSVYSQLGPFTAGMLTRCGPAEAAG